MNKTGRRAALRVAVSMIALATTAIAHAQEPAPASADIVSATEVAQADTGEILVTARRRAEDPQNVPIALSVFGGQALERQNIFTVDQLQRQAPSLQIIGNNPRNTNINIRGLGANIGLQNDGLENGVGVYVDDVYYARTGQAIFDLVDLERIELLRGPQGTLFGKNTTAGALSIYTREPGFTPNLTADASIGTHGSYQLRASAGAPIIGDTVAARLSVAQTSHDGYLRNVTLGRDVNDYNNLTVRGQILAKIGEDVKLRLIGDYGRQHEDGYASSNSDLVTTRSLNGGPQTPIPNDLRTRVARTLVVFPAFDTRLVLPPYDAFDRDVALDRRATVRMSQGGGSAKLDWTLPNHVLTVISAYRFWNWKPRNDADGVPLPVLTEAYNDSKHRQFSQEVRLASTGNDAFDYVLGAYYFHQTLNSFAQTAYGAAAPIWLLPIATGSFPTAAQQAALDGFAVFGTSRLKLDSYAGFGQFTWKITPALSLTGGLRYTRERKDGSFVQTVTGPSLAALPAADQATAIGIRNSFGAPNAYTAATRENKLSGQVNLSYRLSDAVLAYGTYARGFKSGGLTLTNVGPSVPKTIAPESIDHFEVGLKTRTADRVLTLNLAGFWTIDRNYQATIYDPVRTTTYVSNVGKVRSRGFEAEAQLAPAEGITAYAAATYLDARYLSFANSTCPIEQFGTPSCDLSGRRLPGAPRWTLAGGGEVSHPVGGDVSVYLGADVSYRTKIYYASNLSASSRIPGYALVNARAGARFGEALDVSVWARNLFDKDYFVTRQAGAFNTGLVGGVIGDPRILGLTARIRY